MKRFLFLSTIYIGCLLFFSGCTEYIYIKEDNIDTDTYTIMLYGCGGGNLDDAMQINLTEAIAEGVNERVRFTGQIKYSKEYQKQNPEHKGTLRFLLENADDGKIVPSEVLSETLPLHDPQTLADFISWSKKSAPADKYILILWNHGDGWTPGSDSLKTRGVCFDDNLEGMPSLSLDDLINGIKLSDTRFKMIYYDACHMAVIENYAALGQVADYAMGASHTTPGIGGDYSSLINNLTYSSDFEQAMTDYCNDVICHWDISQRPYDLGLFDLSYVDEILGGIALLSETINEIMHLDTSSVYYNPYLFSYLEGCITFTYRFSTSLPYYDIGHLAESLAYHIPDKHYTPIFVRAASTISRGLSRAFVCHCKTSALAAKNITIGVTMLHKKDWAKQGYEGVYQQLLFDQKTKWSVWLKDNVYVPLKDQPVWPEG